AKPGRRLARSAADFDVRVAELERAKARTGLLYRQPLRKFPAGLYTGLADAEPARVFAAGRMADDGSRRSGRRRLPACGDPLRLPDRVRAAGDPLPARDRQSYLPGSPLGRPDAGPAR